MSLLEAKLTGYLIEAKSLDQGLALRCSNPAAIRNMLHRLRKLHAQDDPELDTLNVRICPYDRAVVWITKTPGNVGRPKNT